MAEIRIGGRDDKEGLGGESWEMAAEGGGARLLGVCKPSQKFQLNYKGK